MARLEIEDRLVDVDDSFLKLSPADQESTVNEIAATFAKPAAKEEAPSQMFASVDPMGSATGFSEEVKPPKPSDRIGYVEDIGKTILPGVARGAAGIAGVPHFISAGADKIAAFPGRMYNKLFGTGNYEDTEGMKQGAALQEGKFSLEPPSAQQIVTGLETVTGPLYQPKTLPGQFANTIAEFSVGGPLTSGSKLARVGQVVAPAFASESLGQVTKGTDLEPYARFAGALAGGVGASLAGRTSAVEKTVARGLKDVSVQQVDDAERLFAQAQEMGLPLTRAEALAQTVGGQTRLNDLQRFGEGQGALHGFMAKRPGQVENVGRTAFDDLAPVNTAPSAIGPAVSDAAGQVVANRQAAINRATRGDYNAATAERVGPQINGALIDDPLYATTLAEIRANPALNRTIANLSDDSVGVLDLVQRRLREQAENARMPGQASSSNLVARNLEDARTPVIAAAETATGSRPGVAGSYESARAAQEALREKYLTPLMNGPLGQVMRHPKTEAAIETLFPRNPLPNSQGEIAKAVNQLQRINPKVAQDVVRAHVESTFNDATRQLQAGANQFGGASFAAQLRGNVQQAENLQAAITALHGPKTWQGFEKMLDIMAATGQRQRIGSPTSFNDQFMSEMKGTGLVRGAAQAAAGGFTKLPSKVIDKFDSWNLGRNTDKLAELLTDKNAAVLFRGLADSKSEKNIQFFLTRMVGAKETIDARPMPRAAGR